MCLHMCVCICGPVQVLCLCGGQTRVSTSRQLWLWVIVSLPTWVLGMALGLLQQQKVPLITELPLQP